MQKKQNNEKIKIWLRYICYSPYQHSIIYEKGLETFLNQFLSFFNNKTIFLNAQEYKMIMQAMSKIF